MNIFTNENMYAEYCKLFREKNHTINWNNKQSSFSQMFSVKYEND